MKLRIVAPGTRTVFGAQVYLDDKRLERVADVKVEMGVGDVNRAYISFYPTGFELEGDFEVEASTAGKPIPVPLIKEDSHAQSDGKVRRENH